MLLIVIKENTGELLKKVILLSVNVPIPHQE